MNDGVAPSSEPAGLINAALRRILGAPVIPVTTSYDFHNVHFRATTPAGCAVFVKVFDDWDYWPRAITAAPVVEPLLVTPRLLEHGELGPGRWWISYEWIDLEPFAPTEENLRHVGTMLGRLHASTRGAVAGFAEHDLDAEIVERAHRLALADPDAAERVRGLHARWGRTELPGATGLIHGDFHWRNVGLVAGVPVIVDLENVRAGQPIVDFGKLVDLDGLADPAQREAFFRGHERHAAAVWPWHEAMRTVRLWTTCGVLVYSLATGLDEFAAHGYRRLAELESLGR